MKKFLSMILMVAVVALAIFVTVPSMAWAGTAFNIEATTAPVTEAFTLTASNAWSSGYTLTASTVAGTFDLSSITISNSGTNAQTVSLYTTGGSTTTVTLLVTVIVPATAGFYRPFGDMNFNDRLTVTDFLVRKSTTATNVFVTGIKQ